jgi:cyclic-di-AMP phosphodiesterase PgpH
VSSFGRHAARERGPRLWPRALLFVGLLALLQVAVLFPILPSRLHVHEGDIASGTITAPRAFSYNSDVLRKQLQDQAISAVPQAYAYDVAVKNRQLAALTDLTNAISNTRIDTTLSYQQKVDALSSRVPGLTAEQANEILAFSSDDWNTAVQETQRLLGTVLEDGFVGSDVAPRRASLPNRVRAGITTQQGDVAVALVRNLIVPTESIDQAGMQKAQDQAAAAVPLQGVTFARGQVIVRDGDAIDAAKLEALQNAGLLTARLRYSDLGAVLVIVAIVACVLAGYLAAFEKRALESWRQGLLLSLILGGLVLAAKVYMPLVLPDNHRQFMQFAFPAAAAPLLAASLFDAGLGVAVAAIAALMTTFTDLYLSDISGVVGLSALQPLEMATAFTLAGIAAVLVVRRAERLNRFLLAGGAVALVTTATLFGFWLLDPGRTTRDAGWLLLAGAVNGVASSLLTVGTFVLLGSVFNISTRLQLMELAQLNAPLLKRLQEEAPGTFHHSILVGNLGERAADQIGADALLVRVGCDYHDIGKLSRPGFFVENQFGGGNPHEAIDPLASNRIIQEHVRYGDELARRVRLPEPVRAFTTEHHGTRLVAFFYRKAAESDPEIDPGIFAYPGPRPRTRETAIAMLADSTEAIVRSSRDHSHERIDALVEGVIAERLAEGQFDECDLTLKDLRTIAESFKATLRAMYHARIEYPAPTETEKRRRGLRVRLGAMAQADEASEPEVRAPEVVAEPPAAAVPRPAHGAHAEAAAIRPGKAASNSVNHPSRADAEPQPLTLGAPDDER